MKKKFKIEYLVYLFILMLPILDFVTYQFTKNNLVEKINYIYIIKSLMPLILFIYLSITLKGKERIWYISSNIAYLAYTAVLTFIFKYRYLKLGLIPENLYLNNLNILFNLCLFVILYLAFYKIFYRKNWAKLRLALNYSLAIYMLGTLLIIISESYDYISAYLLFAISMLLIVTVSSLRFKKDRSFSILVFLITTVFLFTRIRMQNSYTAIILIIITYLYSIFLERYLNNTFDINTFKQWTKNIIVKFKQHILKLQKTKKLESGDTKFVDKKKISPNVKLKYSKYNKYKIVYASSKDKDINKYKAFKKIDDEHNGYDEHATYNKKYLEDHRIKSSENYSNNKYKKEYDRGIRSKPKFIIEMLKKNLTYLMLFIILITLISLTIIAIHKAVKKSYMQNKEIYNQYLSQKTHIESSKLQKEMEQYSNLITVNENLNIAKAKNISIYLIYSIPLIYVFIKNIKRYVFEFDKVDSEHIIIAVGILGALAYLTIYPVELMFFSNILILSIMLIILFNKTIEDNNLNLCKNIDLKTDYLKNEGLTDKIKCKRRILFGINNLDISGVSRILLDLKAGLEKQYPFLDIEIFTIFDKSDHLKNTDIEINSLFKKKVTEYSDFKKFLIYLYLKLFEPTIYGKHIRGKYDTIVSFDDKYITSLFSYTDEGSKKIAWIFNKKFRLFEKENRKDFKSLHNIYKRYDEFVFSKEADKRRFEQVFKSKKIKNTPKRIIKSYVDPLRIYENSIATTKYDFSTTIPSLLTVVRLYKHKGIDRIIRVHKRLINDGYMHNIYIIGDGPEKASIERKIMENNIENSFFLLGTKQNPYPYIKKAEFFFLFSLKENSSNVLSEAMILNKKILITDTETKYLIKDYPNAKVFENSESGIYNGLRYILSSNNLSRMNFDYIYKNEDILKQVFAILFKNS